MFFYVSIIFMIIISIGNVNGIAPCGCKVMRDCYHNMLDKLLTDDEASCVEDSAIGAATIVVYLKAISLYCKDFVKIVSNSSSFEHKHIHEVVIFNTKENSNNSSADPKPVILIDAGQEGGVDAVGVAMMLIQQLVACEEYEEMITNVKWVIVPCANPDGMEYGRYKTAWRKNCHLTEDNSYGVDITRNFDSHFSVCDGSTALKYSLDYRGPNAASENETIFISELIRKYKNEAKIYLTIKKDGHHISYPYAHSGETHKKIDLYSKISSEIAYKVNQKSLGVSTFMADNIHNLEGKPHCGHSVDFATDVGIALAFEMRVFFGSGERITSLFQAQPSGYRVSLKYAYLYSIRELYNVITNTKKYGSLE